MAAVIGVALIFVLAWLDMRRYQARSFADFKALQVALAREGASAASARMEALFDDLAMLAGVPAGLSPAELERLLVARVEHGRYLTLDLYDGDRPVAHRAAGTDAPAATGLTLAELDAPRARLLRALATAPEGSPLASPLLDGGEAGPLRLHALRVGGRSALALLRVRSLLAADRSTAVDAVRRRWVALDLDPGQAAEAAPGSVRSSWVALDAATGQRSSLDSPSAPAMAQVSALTEAVQHGGEGSVALQGEASGALGIDVEGTVVGYAPVRAGGAVRWSVAVAASTERVRRRNHMALVRLGTSTGLAGLLVALLGTVVRSLERRERALGEQLRLAAATAALRERAEKLVEAMPVGVMTLAPPRREGDVGVVSSVNPYLAERGLAPAADLASALPEAAPADRAVIATLVAEARAVRLPRQHLGARLPLGGELRDVDVYAVPLAQPLPDADCFLLLHDRTDVRALEQTLVRADKLATIGTLAAGVAHEVGTPLGIISGRAEQILARLQGGSERGERDAQERRALGSILAQVEKVSVIIRQLLDFSRHRPVRTVAVRLGDVLGGVEALLEHRFRQAEVALAVDVQPGLAPVRADPGQLEQVLVNLVLNACDACPPGGHVRVRAAAREDGVVVEVSDDGCGIPPELLPRVTDPFFTTKKRGQGTGLGLTIVADIVKNHEGTLEIESVPHRGTTVRVTLPMADAPSEHEGDRR